MQPKARSFPKPLVEDCEIEIRQLFELEDFGQFDGTERLREIGISTEK